MIQNDFTKFRTKKMILSDICKYIDEYTHIQKKKKKKKKEKRKDSDNN